MGKGNTFSSYSEEQQVYHCALLIEAELVHGRMVEGGEGEVVGGTNISRLTWKGHEFLDAARNETVWKKSWERIKKSGIQVSLSVLEELLKAQLKEALNLP